MPNRVLRQFGYVQVIPPTPFIPRKVYMGSSRNKYICEHDPMKTNWDTWQQHTMRPGDMGSFRARFTTEVADNYLSWFTDRTHIRVQHISAPSSLPKSLPFHEMPDRAVSTFN